MADKKISQLPAAGTASNTDTYAVVQPTGTKSQTLDAMRTAIFNGAKGTSANYNIGTSGDTIPLLSGANTFSKKQVFSVAGATSLTDYCAEFRQSGGTSNAGRALFSQGSTYGFAVSVNGSGSTTARVDLQFVNIATGAIQSVPLQLNYDGSLIAAAGLSAVGPVRPGQYTLTTLPSASAYNGYEIDVTNATGGSKRCRSNGSVWQILNTTTTVS